MRIPTSYNELTVSQYVKAYEIMHDEFDNETDRMTSWISLFTGLNFYESEGLNIEVYKDYADKLKFLKSELPLYHVNDTVNIEGFTFVATKKLTDMKVNQMIDFLELYKANENNLHKCLDKLLPIIYIHKKYDPDKHEENVARFGKAKISEVSGLVFFYSDYWLNSEKIITAYIESQTKLIQERMDWIAENPQLIPS